MSWDPWAVPAQAASPHLLLPRRVLRRPGSCQRGRTATSSTAGFVGVDWVLSVWTQANIPSKPPQRVLRRQDSCWCGRGNMSSIAGPVGVDAETRTPQRVLTAWTRTPSSTAGPEEAELLSARTLPHALHRRSLGGRAPVGVDMAPRPPQRVLRRPDFCQHGHNPMSSTAGPVGVGANPRPTEASTAGPEEARLLSQRLLSQRLRMPGCGWELGSCALYRQRRQCRTRWKHLLPPWVQLSPFNFGNSSRMEPNIPRLLQK